MPAHMAQKVGAHLRLLEAHNQKLAAEIERHNGALIERLERLERLAAGNNVLIERLEVKMIWLTIIAVIIAVIAVIIAVFTTYATESNVPSLQRWSHAIESNVTIESDITALQEQYHAIKSNITSLQRRYHTTETNITSPQQQYCTIKTQLIHAFTPHEIPVCDSQPSQYVGDKEEPSVQGNNVLQSTVWIIYKVLFTLFVSTVWIIYKVLFTLFVSPVWIIDKVLFVIGSLFVRVFVVLVYLVLILFICCGCTPDELWKEVTSLYRFFQFTVLLVSILVQLYRRIANSTS